MRRVSALLLLAAALCLAASCGGARYGEVKSSIAKMSSAMETLILELGRADAAPAVAKALNDFTDATLAEQERFKGLMAKYPELRDEAPLELKESLDKLNAVRVQVYYSIEKAQGFADDPAVVAAMSRLGQLLQMQ